MLLWWLWWLWWLVGWVVRVTLSAGHPSEGPPSAAPPKISLFFSLYLSIFALCLSLFGTLAKTDFGENRLWPKPTLAKPIWPKPTLIVVLCCVALCSVVLCCVVWRGYFSRFHGVGFHVWVLVSRFGGGVFEDRALKCGVLWLSCETPASHNNQRTPNVHI